MGQGKSSSFLIKPGLCLASDITFEKLMPQAQWRGGKAAGQKCMVSTRKYIKSVQELVLSQESQLGTC